MQAADATNESLGQRMHLHQIPPLLVHQRRTTLWLLGSSAPKPPKPEFKTLVHFTMEFLRTVMLSAAKNLTARPFTPFRVTILVCQSLEARFSIVDVHLLVLYQTFAHLALLPANVKNCVYSAARFQLTG